MPINIEHRSHSLSRSTRQATLILAMALIASVRVFAQQPTAPPTAAATSHWQPKLHFTAPPNWINDPNGPIFLNGQYHLFFQNNPFGGQWGHMSWGHAVSSDLIHWKQLPVALPEENGIAIFSGSTVQDNDNTSALCGNAGEKTPGCLVAIYTGNSQDKQTQNIAVSRDNGGTWTKYSGNPVIDLGLKDFRDPKVFWHTASKSWVMVVALPTLHKVRFYRSSNLRQWEQAGEFGPAGAVSGDWECPDLFELPVRDDNGNLDGSRWVLNVNLNPGGPAGGSGDQYFVGKFDGSHFTMDHPNSGAHWADWGKDFYASTSFSNLPPGQDPIWIAWMSNWQYASKLPSMPGRGEMTLARSLFLREPPAHPAPTPGQEPLQLVQQPVLPIPDYKPYAAMFGAPQFQSIAAANERLAKGKSPGSVFVIRFDLEPGEGVEAGIRLRRSAADPNASAQEETLVGVNTEKGLLFLDRTRSGKTDWSPDFPARMIARLKHPQLGSIRLEIVVDKNSIEVFADDGETVLTSLIYPSESSQGLSFYATPMPPGFGPARIRNIELFPIEPPATGK
jgi:sucrose-6-phosphate hydrolase SacC (GH32 family)